MFPRILCFLLETFADKIAELSDEQLSKHLLIKLQENKLF